MSEKLLTTAEAAIRLGLSIRQTQTLIQKGTLPAVKFGRDYQIKTSDCDRLAPRQPGWPAGKKRGPKKPPKESTND